MREGLLDAIPVTTSGCGTMVKDCQPLPATAAMPSAAYVAGLARDITEHIDEIGLMPPVMWTGLKVTITRRASQHGQRIDTLPVELLNQAGFSVAEIPRDSPPGSAGPSNAPAGA
jgi:glycolate oxidase iron-sulfur subunit